MKMPIEAHAAVVNFDLKLGFDYMIEKLTKDRNAECIAWVKRILKGEEPLTFGHKRVLFCDTEDEMEFEIAIIARKTKQENK